MNDDNNQPSLESFYITLISKMRQCFKCKNNKVLQEKMWGLYHVIPRYVAGYVCRKLCDRPENKSSPLKEDVGIAMIEMAGDDMDEEGQGSEEWLNKIDRGLWHVNDNVYSLFVSMEYEAKRILQIRKISN